MNIWQNKSLLLPAIGVRQFSVWMPLFASGQVTAWRDGYFCTSPYKCMCIYLSVYICMCICMHTHHIQWVVLHSIPFVFEKLPSVCLLCPSVISPHCFLIFRYLLQKYSTDFFFSPSGIFRLKLFFFFPCSGQSCKVLNKTLMLLTTEAYFHLFNLTSLFFSFFFMFPASD